MNSDQSTNPKNQRRLLTALLVLLLLGAFGGYQYFNNSDSDSSSDLTASQTEMTNEDLSTSTTSFAKLVVDRPFEKIPSQSNEMVVQDPTTPTVFTLASGTVIKIPPNAFSYANGNLITTPVNIEFSDFQEPAEIIASGIPMMVAGEEGSFDWMQTAGMFEIRGNQNGEPVNIANGKNVEVTIQSTDGNYDFWTFDEEGGDWVNKGEASAATEGDLDRKAVQQEINQLQKATAAAPVNPVDEENNKLIFSDLDLSKCPNLKNRKSVALAYAGTDKSKSPAQNKWITKPGIWHKKTLKPTDDANLYQLTLLGDKMYQVEVRIALEGAELERAKAQYETKLAEYKRNIVRLKNKQDVLNRQAVFYRTVAVAGFGIHNYDILWKLPNAVKLLADFEFEDVPAAQKGLITVYFISQNNQLVVGLKQNSWDKFRFAPNMDNKMIAVLPNEKVAVFTQKDFEKNMDKLIDSDGKNYTFNMTTLDKKVETIEDLNEVIDLASL